MFAFLEKKQKDLENKMEELDKDNKKGSGGLSSLGKLGGAVVGAFTGGPAGAVAGAQAGEQIGGAVDGAVSGKQDDDKSNQVAMMKLNQEMQEMNQMFSLVDNMLKSMNDVVKQGPLAAIRG